MKKNLLFISAFTALAISTFTGCSSNDNRTKIGILQPNHPALEAASNGFIKGLEEEGFNSNKVRFIKRAPKQDGSDLNALAKDMVSQCSLSLGVATDPAKALKAASIDKGLTNPILFTAVTDPIGAGLVKSLDNGEGFLTGTSDINPVEQQIQLIKEILPDVDKVGILYTVSEDNSKVQADMAQAEVVNQGWTAVAETVRNASEISTIAQKLVQTEGLDAIYIPTDNTIAANTGAIKAAVQGTGKLVVCGEESMLKGCGSVTLSIDYFKLGKMTGKMAAQILKGEKKAKEIPVGFIALQDCEYVMSLNNAREAGVTIPQDVQDTSRNVD